MTPGSSSLEAKEEFSLLLADCWVRVFRFMRTRGYSFSESEDLTQDVFLRAYRGIESLEHRDSLHRWIFSIASNVLKNKQREQGCLKRRAQEIPLDDLESRSAPKEPEDSEPIQEVLRRERAKAVTRAIEGLPTQMRHCLLLFLRGHKCQEIAAALKTTPATVRVQLSQGRSRLRAHIRSGFE